MKIQALALNKHELCGRVKQVNGIPTPLFSNWIFNCNTNINMDSRITWTVNAS